jgi:SAM-dependent methyltransferase
MTRTCTPPDAYRADLAFIHDAGFGQLAEDAAARLIRTLRRDRIEGGLVVDLGCGSGRLSRRVADAGHDVLGIDISPAMIALARRHVPGGRFHVGSILDAKLPRCVAVAAIGEVFNYLFDAENSPRALAALLGRIHEALEPGGLLIFDVAEPGRANSTPRPVGATGADWAVIAAAEEDRRRALLCRRITSFRRVGASYRRDDEVHWLRLIRRTEIDGLLRALGFQVRVLRAYGPRPFARGHVGFLARKRRRPIRRPSRASGPGG